MLGRRNGFTLVELLAVIVVLAIIMIIAVPTVMRSMEAGKRNSFVIQARKVVNVAIAKRQANEILNDPDKNSIRVTVGGNLDHYCYTLSSIGVDSGGRYHGTIAYYPKDPDTNEAKPVWKVRLGDGEFETKHQSTGNVYIELEDIVDYNGTIQHVVASETPLNELDDCCFDPSFEGCN